MNKSSLVRITEIDRLIRSGKARNALYIAEALEINKRTVERDIQTMRMELGADIVYNKKKRCYEYRDGALTLPGQWLSKKEIALILASEKAMRIFTDTSFHDEIHPAFNNFRDPVRSYSEEMEYILALCRAIYFSRSFEPKENVARNFDLFATAIAEGKAIRMDYYTIPSIKSPTREIEPYALVNNDGEWMVVGYCKRSKGIKTFSLLKAENIAIVDRYIVVPQNFDPYEYTLHKFDSLRPGEETCEIELRADRSQRDYITSTLWHPSQSLRHFPDGSIGITLRCSITQELKKWILSFGSSMWVIGPKTLKDVIKSEIEGMVGLLSE